MDTDKENANLNMIVAAYVKLTQLNASMAVTREEWEHTLTVLNHLDVQNVVILTDKDKRALALIRAELKRVADMLSEMKFKYDPEVYVGEVLQRNYKPNG